MEKLRKINLIWISFLSLITFTFVVIAMVQHFDIGRKGIYENILALLFLAACILLPLLPYLLLFKLASRALIHRFVQTLILIFTTGMAGFGLSVFVNIGEVMKTDALAGVLLIFIPLYQLIALLIFYIIITWLNVHLRNRL